MARLPRIAAAALLLALVSSIPAQASGRSVSESATAGQVTAQLTQQRTPSRLAGDRFAYEFTAYAFSVLPVRVWHYSAGTLTDVTRSFPRLAAADAKRNLRGYRQERRDPEGDVRGALAAYVADEYLLGHRAVGWR